MPPKSARARSQELLPEGTPPKAMVANVEAEKFSLLDGWEPPQVAKWVLNRTGDPILADMVVKTATDGSRLARVDDELQNILDLDDALYKKIKKKVRAMERTRKDELRMSFTDVARNESEREAAAARLPASRSVPATQTSCRPPDGFEPEPELQPEDTFTDVEGVALNCLASGLKHTGKLRISRAQIQHLIRDPNGRTFAAILPLHLVEQSKTKVHGDKIITLTLSVNHSEFSIGISLEFPDKAKRTQVERNLQLEKAERDRQRAQSTVQGSLTMAGVRWDVEKQETPDLDAIGNELSKQQSSRVIPDKIEIKNHMKIKAGMMGSHVEYAVECVSASYDDPWQVTKRYKEFLELKNNLVREYEEFSRPVEGCAFPHKERNPDLAQRELELVKWSNAVLRVIQIGIKSGNYLLAKSRLEAFFDGTDAEPLQDGMVESIGRITTSFVRGAAPMASPKKRVQNPDDPKEGWGVVIPAMPKGVNCLMLDQYCGKCNRFVAASRILYSLFSFIFRCV